MKGEGHWTARGREEGEWAGLGAKGVRRLLMWFIGCAAKFEA